MSEVENLKGLLEEDAVSWSYRCSDESGWKTIDRIELDSGRWTKHVQVITQGPSGKLYRWDYEEGLTEYQDDLYEDFSIEEVVPVEKIVKIIEYVKV